MAWCVLPLSKKTIIQSPLVIKYSLSVFVYFMCERWKWVYSRFTQQIVFKLNLWAEEIVHFSSKDWYEAKLSSTESGTPKIRWHLFKEHIKQNTLKRTFHYSTWTYFPTKSDSLFSWAQFAFSFLFPFRLIFHCAVQKSHSGTWRNGWEITTDFVTRNATTRKEGEKKGNPQFPLPRGGWE